MEGEGVPDMGSVVEKKGRVVTRWAGEYLPARGPGCCGRCLKLRREQRGEIPQHDKTARCSPPSTWDDVLIPLGMKTACRSTDAPKGMWT